MEENLKTTDELLEDVVNANLQDLLINQFDDEKQKKEVFDDTMKAVDRLTRMKEISSSDDKGLYIFSVFGSLHLLKNSLTLIIYFFPPLYIKIILFMF